MDRKKKASKKRVKSKPKVKGKLKATAKVKAKAKAPKKKTGTSLRKIPFALSKGSGLHVAFPGKVTPTQLDLFGNLKYEDWGQALFKVAQVRDGGSWWVGDAINYGDKHYGEMYAQAASETGISEDTLTTLKYVASRVSPERRIKELTWSHHREVAKFPDDEQSRWLGMALNKTWTVRDLKEAIRKKGQRTASDGQENLPLGAICIGCGASSANIKICAKCAALPSKALETVGVKAAIALLNKKPSKPQLAFLKWAFEHIQEPTHENDEDSVKWAGMYEGLKNIVQKAA